WPLSLPDVLFKFEAEYLEYNFLGLGWQFSVPVQYGFSTNDYLRLGSFIPTLRIPRPGGTDLHIELKLLAELDRVTDQLDRTEFGLYSSLNWPVMKQMSLGFGLDFGLICFKNPDAREPICEIAEYSPQFRPSIRWRWDTQDNPLNPTSGFTLGAEFKYIFGRSRDELVTLDIGDQLSDTYANFLKWEVSAEIVVDTRIGPILAAFVRYGGSYQLDSDVTSMLPANEVFTLGGSNGMRGFGDHAVGRYDADGNLDPLIVDFREDGGGNVVINGSVELRIPILKSLGVWGATFLDAGAIARNHSEIYSDSFRFSTGIGLRYLIGQQIPVRLDWGIALGNRRCVAWDAVDSDTCRKEDGHRVHFDLLYPF
ncbi:MAG: BamA/TamA family outer membrane protein, partial [Myxococcota bacterium]|nr:BamA/TamA family outer membrane protein [Myxococcota bacterium]